MQPWDIASTTTKQHVADEPWAMRLERRLDVQRRSELRMHPQYTLHADVFALDGYTLSKLKTAAAAPAPCARCVSAGHSDDLPPICMTQTFWKRTQRCDQVRPRTYYGKSEEHPKHAMPNRAEQAKV